jgi:hypothetical protein
MSELIPKYNVNDVVRAEWEGKSIIARITEVTFYTKLKCIGYRTNTGQYFREEELSNDTPKKEQ